MTQRFSIEPGNRFPTGASVSANGVNFSMFSRNATRVWLRLYRTATDETPLLEVQLDPRVHRTFFFWHVFVAGASAGLCYTWRVDGPADPARGMRFDARRELLDPWARLVAPHRWDRAAAMAGKPSAIRAVVPPRDDYDWEDDEVLDRSLRDAVIYELHVGGFTRHASSGVEHPGTFAGLIEKIPYLRSLGVTDVELMPVAAFDEQDVPPRVAARGLKNYWGYSPYGFFAPHPRFAASADARNEFRDLVKALHRAGLGVILDVVLNHTAEGGNSGVTISFKGFGNEFFYHLDPDDRSLYRDFTGCGNTINCNHPLVARFLLQCLEFWVRDMHVDGFRVDLASVLSRGEDGEPLYHAPVLWSMEFSGYLATAHLIAEAWDAVGLHQVGDFPGFRWAEWNGFYRDALRRFMRGEGGMLGEVATRIAGSSDLYDDGRHPTNSINFIACHDGFTLYDLVSYDRKHNEANGEDDRDGSDHNFSWNSGVEGATRDPAVIRLREQRIRNFLAVLFVSQGVPMIHAGDERLRTQHGNNNAYCQDNETSWLDWRLDASREALLRFTREMIALRSRHPSLRRKHFFEPGDGDGAQIRWFGETLEPPAWHDAEARVLCFTIAGVAPGEPALHVMLNMSRGPKELPLPPRVVWHRVVDTSLAPPLDIVPGGVRVAASRYRVPALGVAIFEAGS
jgi:glycogen operon protein